MIASTGFLVSGDATNIQFFDDDGTGNLRRFYLVGTTRTYTDNNAGTVNYINGQIKMRDGKILGDPEGKPLKF